MTRIKAIVGAVLAGGAIAAGVLLGGRDGGDTGAGAADTTASAVRAVRLDGACPQDTGKERPKCAQTIQRDGYCICITAQEAGTVDGEVTSASMGTRPPKDRRRLVVCDVDGGTEARWESSERMVPATCTVAVDAAVVPDVSATAIELGDTEEQLRRVCAPCRVSAGSWGPCPHCLRWPGGCAAACR